MSRSDVAVLFSQIHRRMVESGEWDRICAHLAERLNESGWTDDVHHRSKESARAAQFQWSQYLVTSLLEEIQPHAESSVPSEVRQEILRLIRQFLDVQIEK